MKINNKNIKRWSVLSLVITEHSDYYADECLSKVLEQLRKKLEKNPEFKITDNYVFISLKNTYLNMLERENVQSRKKMSLNESTYFDEVNFIETDLEKLQEVDDEMQSKLEAISGAYSEVLNTFEQQLFYIHFKKGISQRQISRDTNINVMVINNKISKIKTKIKEYYAKNN